MPASAPPLRPLGAMVGVAALALFGALERPASPPPVASAGFTHAKHVPSAWYAKTPAGYLHAEVPRDCRGCHSFSVVSGRETSSDPQNDCSACHYGSDKAGRPVFDLPDPKPDWLVLSAGWRLADEKPGAFLHGDHGALFCRDCHAGVIEDGPGGGFAKDLMEVPRGSVFCAGCHDPTREKDEPPRTFAGGKTKAVCAKLDESPRMAHVDRFRHDEHGRIEDMTGPGSCVRCHDLAKSTARDLEKSEYPEASCRDCHVAKGTVAPLVFAHRDDARPSRAAMTFDHADHLGARGAKDPEIREKSCLACHQYDSGAATYDLKPAFATYGACAECHERVRVADPAPADGKLPPHVGDHGSWTDPDGWGNCGKCHAAFESKDDGPRRTMKSNRPLAARGGAAAGGEATFRIASHEHLHVTSPNGEPVHGRCRECHVAELKVLPSRIVTARFSHATHVAKDAAAGSAACAKCHSTDAMKSRTLDDIYDRNYDPTACGECHLGPKPERIAPPSAPRRPRADIDHVFHLSKNAPGTDRPMVCADCHVADAAGGGADYALKPGAGDCVSCHKHDDKFAHITGGKGAAYVAACTSCHSEYVPSQGEIVQTVRRTVVGLESGVQFHDPSSAISCRGCHQVDVPSRLRDERVHVHAAVKPPNPHTTSSDRGGVPYPKVAGGGDVDCDNCHWRGWESYGDNLLTPPLKGMRQKVGEVRTRRGALMDAFPGGGTPR